MHGRGIVVGGSALGAGALLDVAVLVAMGGGHGGRGQKAGSEHVLEGDHFESSPLLSSSRLSKERGEKQEFCKDLEKGATVCLSEQAADKVTRKE